MSLSLVAGNLGSWAVQTLLLIAVTGAVLALLRVTDPRLRLRTWHGILGAALLLPAMQPWRYVIERAASPSVDAGRDADGAGPAAPMGGVLSDRRNESNSSPNASRCAR